MLIFEQSKSGRANLAQLPRKQTQVDDIPDTLLRLLKHFFNLLRT